MLATVGIHFLAFLFWIVSPDIGVQFGECGRLLLGIAAATAPLVLFLAVVLGRRRILRTKCDAAVPRTLRLYHGLVCLAAPLIGESDGRGSGERSDHCGQRSMMRILVKDMAGL